MQPEQDNELHYWACNTCGSETDYIRIRPAADACQLGLAPAVRAAASTETGSSNGRSVFIGDIPVRRPRAGDGL
jgi:hypothetical protein